MALPLLDRQTFLGAAQRTIDRAANHVNWAEQLLAYEWGGAGWRAGLAARNSMHQRMTAARSHQQHLRAFAEILTWGGLPPLGNDVIRQVLASLPLLDDLARSGDAPQSDLYAGRIASVSKIYAMHSPSQWVIYDSRVARALARIVLRAHPAAQIPAKFPQPPGRTGAPAAGFPRLSSAPQARCAFVFASWLAQQLASRIAARCPDARGWDARHVEMALFVMGSPSQPTHPVKQASWIDQTVARIDAHIAGLADEQMLLEAARKALIG